MRTLAFVGVISLCLGPEQMDWLLAATNARVLANPDSTSADGRLIEQAYKDVRWQPIPVVFTI